MGKSLKVRIPRMTIANNVSNTENVKYVANKDGQYVFPDILAWLTKITSNLENLPSVI